MAVRRRRPRGTLIHSDQGTQYGSDAWRRFCRSNHLEPSMSRKGNCWDNAVAESFFSSLKKERIKKQIYKNRELALTDVADYIDTLLQSNPPSQSPRRREPRAVRSGSQAAATRCPLNPGNSRRSSASCLSVTLRFRNFHRRIALDLRRRLTTSLGNAEPVKPNFALETGGESTHHGRGALTAARSTTGR